MPQPLATAIRKGKTTVKNLVNRNGTQRRRWLAVAVLSALITVQISPYLALATAVPESYPTQRQRQSPTLDEANLLAQLDRLPNGTASLANFDPAVDGFQFSNQELVEAIDLRRNAQNWEVVLIEQMKQLFGRQVCVGAVANGCVLTAAAQNWLQTQLSRIDQGISEGMAAAVLDLWQPTPTPIPWWQRLINTLLGRTVFGLARTLFDLQTFIANLFLMQGLPEVFQPTQTIRTTLTPTQILLTLVRVFVTGSGDPFTMGVYRLLEGALTDGHSLTPYRVESRGNGKYWVYVYDSNYPPGRPTSPQNLHVEFDTRADSWSYQPWENGSTALAKNQDAPLFEGNAESQTLDLTQRSWRHSSHQLPAEPQSASTAGPFTCVFCVIERASGNESGGESGGATAPLPTVAVTLVGEGHMTVTPYPGADRAEPVPPLTTPVDQVERVPFRGGLNREVPASYHFSAEVLNQPLRVDLTGVPGAKPQTTTLQLTGPGFTANLMGLTLVPQQTLTLYLVATATGPEITFVANQVTPIPHLSISLMDGTTTSQFDASSSEIGFALTERQVSKSSGVDLVGLRLPQGKRLALTANTDLKHIYFADDTLEPSTYTLTVTNRMVVTDRTQIGVSRPDFEIYTLTYDEEMRASGVGVGADEQAFFDYGPAFINPGQRSRDQLFEALAQRQIPVTIAYEPLSPSALTPGPLALVPSGAAPLRQQVFQGSLGIRELAWNDGSQRWAAGNGQPTGAS